jgi:hypothetical protein
MCSADLRFICSDLSASTDRAPCPESQRSCFCSFYCNSIEGYFASKADSLSDSHEAPRILWKPKVHYCVHKSPPPDPVVSQMNPVHTLPRHFFKIYCTIILPSTPRSSKSPPRFRFPDKNSVCISHIRSLLNQIYSPSMYLKVVIKHYYCMLYCSKSILLVPM